MSQGNGVKSKNEDGGESRLTVGIRLLAVNSGQAACFANATCRLTIPPGRVDD